MSKKNEVKHEWATLVIRKRAGGRAEILNSSQRGLFQAGQTYYNHNLKEYPSGAILNVVVRLSAKGRRMIQDLYVKQQVGDYWQSEHVYTRGKR